MPSAFSSAGKNNQNYQNHSPFGAHPFDALLLHFRAVYFRRSRKSYPQEVMT